MAENRDQRASGPAERRKLVDKRRLGELLVETGLLSREAVMEALEVQKGTARRLGEILMEKGLISEEEIAFALAMQLKIPFMDLSDCTIQTDVMETIPLQTEVPSSCSSQAGPPLTHEGCCLFSLWGYKRTSDTLAPGWFPSHRPEGYSHLNP